MGLNAFDRFLNWFDLHKYGILGTLMLHTLVMGGLTIWYVDTIPAEEDRSEISVLVLDEETLEEILAQQELPPETGGPIRNMANNTALERTQEMREYNYRRMSSQATEQLVEDELRQMEQEEFDRLAEERTARGEDVEIPELDKSKWDPANYIPASKPYAVLGRTTVEYDLAGRGAYHLPVPAYKCEGSGTVVVRIVVDSRGRVKQTQVSGSASDACMEEAALDAALHTQFEESGSGSQSGSITYTFVAQ